MLLLLNVNEHEKLNRNMWHKTIILAVYLPSKISKGISANRERVQEKVAILTALGGRPNEIFGMDGDGYRSDG